MAAGTLLTSRRGRAIVAFVRLRCSPWTLVVQSFISIKIDLMGAVTEMVRLPAALRSQYPWHELIRNKTELSDPAPNVCM